MVSGTVRAITREVIALSRNYRHAARLRRHVQAKYGAVIVCRPSVLIGDALIAMENVRWSRLVILAVAIVLAAHVICRAAGLPLPASDASRAPNRLL